MLNGIGYASGGYFHRNGTLIYKKMGNQTLKKVKVPIICNYAIIQSGDCSLSMLIDSKC